jgi:hypothetical protein
MSRRETEIRDAYTLRGEKVRQAQHSTHFEGKRRPLREDWIDKGGSKQPPSTSIPKPGPPPAQSPAKYPAQPTTQQPTRQQ